MIRGIGVDAVSIRDISDLLERMTKGSLSKMFTERELFAASDKTNPAEYLATRFAAKEAVFKAIAPSLPEKSFDFRRVETRNNADGSPYIHVSTYLRDIMDRAGIVSLLISITTTGDMAIAFVIAQS